MNFFVVETKALDGICIHNFKKIGNKARALLGQPELTASILRTETCNITPEYVSMLYDLCVALNCTHTGDIESGNVKRISPEKYHEMAKKVKQKHRELDLNYYPQCPTTHKV